MEDAPRRQVGKAVFNLLIHLSARVDQQGAKLGFKVVVGVGLTDKVQNGQTILLGMKPQPTTELLKENCQAFGGTK